jgi:hypothetical protein
MQKRFRNSSNFIWPKSDFKMKKAFLLCVLFVSFSCQSVEPNEKPEISREKFTEAIAYFAVLEGNYNVSLIREQNGLEILASNYRFAFDSLGFSPDQFEQTYRYYLDDPNEMSKIFDEALSLLNARKAQIDNKIKSLNEE